MADMHDRANPWLVIAMVVGGITVAVLIAAVIGPSSSTDDEPGWSLSDSSCVQSGGLVTYTGTITNDGDTSRTYYMTAVFTGADGVREDTDATMVRDVDAGQSARWRFLGHAASSGTTCSLGKIDER